MQATAEQTTTDQASAAPRLKAVRSRGRVTLRSQDIEDLRWHAKQEQLSGYGGEMSTFAAMIQRLSLMSFGSSNCRRCGGSKTKVGRGFVPLSERIPYAEQLRRYRLRVMKAQGMSATRSEAQAMKLRLLGIDAYTWRVIAEFLPELPALESRLCPECEGRGLVPRTTRDRKRQLTARPNGGSRKGGRGSASTGGSGDLLRQGKVERRLTRVRNLQPRCAFVLPAYYGQDKNILDTPAALLALWPYTQAGRLMLRENAFKLTPREFFANRLREQRMTPNRDREGQHARADEEAQELIDLARVTWNEVGP